MLITKSFRAFDDSLLDLHPDLKAFLKPNDYYPELNNIMKNRAIKLPNGSFNSKVIISDGEIVQRVYKTPKGNFISLFSKSSNTLLDEAA